MKTWNCYLCGLPFIHARYLVTHLDKWHNVTAAMR